MQYYYRRTSDGAVAEADTRVDEMLGKYGFLKCTRPQYEKAKAKLPPTEVEVAVKFKRVTTAKTKARK